MAVRAYSIEVGKKSRSSKSIPTGEGDRRGAAGGVAVLDALSQAVDEIPDAPTAVWQVLGDVDARLKALLCMLT